MARKLLDKDAIKDEYKGETGILVANGPSLQDVPADFLRAYPSMGMNRCNGLLPLGIPTFYCCIGADQMNTPARRDTIKEIVPKVQYAFLNRLFAWDFRWDNVFSILGHATYGAQSPEDRYAFSLDPLQSVGVGATMSHIGLQLMHWLGFETVLIVGMDGHYGDNWHWYPEEDFPDFKSGPGIYKTDENWRNVSELVLNTDLYAYTETGRRIVNLTEGSKIEVFDKQDLSFWWDKSGPTVGEELGD